MRDGRPRAKKENRQKIPRFMRVRYSGRNVLLLGALLLLAMSGYELWTRIDTIRKMIEAFRQGYDDLRISELSGIPFTRYLYVSMLKTQEGTEIVNIMIFLAACTVLAILVICLRNRPRAGYLLITMDVAVFCVGFFILMVFSLNTGDLLQIAKLLPLVLVLLGCLINLFQFYEQRRFRRKNPPETQYGPLYVHMPDTDARPGQPAVPRPQAQPVIMPGQQGDYIPRHSPKGPYFEKNRPPEH